MRELRGKQIAVRGFSREEWHRFWCGFVADPVSGQNPFVYGEAKCDSMYEKATTCAMTHPSLGIFLPDGMPVGFMELKRIDRSRGRCEFGIMMQNDAWKNRGYGTEAIQLLIHYIFNEMGIRRVYADTMGTNRRMQHLFDKLGFRYICTDWAYFSLPGQREDRHNYVLVQREGDMRIVDYALVRALPSLIRNLRRAVRIRKQHE